MPVITPAYPSMCATYNITRSAMTIIQQELQNGANLTDQIMVGQRQWKDLFIKHTFFTQDFKYYLSVTCASKTKEAHKIWSGFVESKVRVLVQNLERHPDISLARPFNKGYDRVHFCKDDAEVEQVQNGSLAFMTKETKAEDPKVKTEDQVVQAKPEPDDTGGVNGEVPDAKVKVEDGQPPAEGQEMEVYTTSHYIGLVLAQGEWLPQPDLTISPMFPALPFRVPIPIFFLNLTIASSTGAKSLDLTFQVNEFKALVLDWDKYEPTLNSVSIQHVRK